MKTSWLSFLAAFLFVANGVMAQAPRGTIITAASPASNPMDPNGDGRVVKNPPGVFSNDGYYVDEFEFKMFGIPKIGGDVNGDNQTGPNCGVTDLIPDTQGYSAYALKDAANNLIFRFRLGSNANSVESWHILLDADGLFGLGKDPNATADNPGFELDITLIKKQSPGVFVINIDGSSDCKTPFAYFPLTSNFQISVGDLVTCGDPDYFYDFYVPFSAVAGAMNNTITPSTGLRYVATTSSSATCSMSGSVSDIGGVDNDDPLYDKCPECAYTDLIEAQCPTAVISLCESCEGFNTGLGIKPTINSISVGQTVISGTSQSAFVKLTIYTNTNPTVSASSPPTWGTTPRETHTVTVTGGIWSITLNGPLQNYDKVVAQSQLSIDGSSVCDSFSSNSSTSVTIVTNIAPVAQPQNLTTPEEVALSITLTATDVNAGDVLTYSIVTAPTHGTLSCNNCQNPIYTPSLNYFGPDSFTFNANDGKIDSNIATISITVTPVNDAPVANNQTIIADEDTPTAITLSATDVDANPLTYIVVTQPLHGTISGSGASLVYTPALNYNGPDSFTFKANDGTVDSNTATISITVNPINDPPVAANQSVTVLEDASVIITLVGTDVDGNSLIYSIVTPPAHGTLSGSGATRTYTPAPNYNGPDSFTFQVNDGTVDSNTATVTITVTPVNDAPVATNQTLTTPEETALPITLSATDVDAGAILTYSIITPPTHGTLSVVTGSGVTYTPGLNYVGPDSFTFKANDGTVDSNVASIFITVTQVNDAPVAIAQNVTVIEDTPKAITLTGSDLDGNALTFQIVTGPLHGTLIGTLPNLTYIPAADYNGPDSFTFKANDGTVDSNTATVTINVTPVNDAPIAQSQTIDIVEEVATPITLVGTDVDGDPLTYIIVTPPQFGVLTGSGPNLIYTANDFAGVGLTDSFTFIVNDGTTNSNVATVFINILPDNDIPFAYDRVVVTDEDTPVSFRISGDDKHLEPITFVNITAPAHGTLSGTAPNLTYTPDPNYTGADSFTFQVFDGVFYSNIATVSITVNPVNDAPVAFDQTVLYQLNTPVNFVLTAFDAEGSPLTYTILTQPTNGVITGTAPNLTFTPNTGFNGTDVLTFKVNDGTVDSNIATVTFSFDNFANDPPVAQDQVVIVIEDTNKNITLGASDPDGDPLTYIIVTQPAHGTLSGTGPNLSYTPDANYNGPDSFTFKVFDGVLNSNTATVSITVTPVNDAPVTTNQVVTVMEDTPKVITLLASDVENSPLTYTVLTQPTHGTLTGSGSSLTYTPDLDYVGPDEFTYRANDGLLNSNTGRVTINVVPVNDLPVAIDDITITTNEDVAVTFSVIGNDTDLDGFIDGATVDLDPSTPAEDKTFMVAGQGIYTVDNAGNVTFTPALNYNGLTTAINYTVKDNEGGLSNTAKIQVNVLPINDAPMATNLMVTVLKNVPEVITLAGTDVENSPLTYTVLTQPTHGTLTGSGGVWTYTPNLDYVGADSFTFKVNDGLLDSSPGTVSINVIPVNSPPVAVNDLITTPEDNAITFSIITNDTDSDGIINGATVDLDPTTPVEDKIFTVVGQGVYTVDNLGNVTFTPALNYNGTTTAVSYTIKDNVGALSNVATIQVNVTPVNDAPVVTPVTVTINEDEPTVICFTVTDVENDPSVFSGWVSLGGHGTVTPAPSSGPFCFLYTPDPDYNGPDQVLVTICDANDPTLCSSGVITINILPVNDPPRVVKNGESVDQVTYTTPEDTPLNLCFDILDPEAGVISVGTITNVTGGGTLVQTAGGANQLCFTFTPAQDFNGEDKWTVVLCDDSNPAQCGTFTLKINVTPVNDASVAHDQNITLPEDTPTAITLDVTDVDGDVLTYTIITAPTHGVISGTGGTITYTPDADYVGNDSFTYKANDGTVDSNVATVTLTITPVNDAPIISSIPVITTLEDTAIDICLGVTDPEGDQITYQSPVMVSGGGTITPSTSFDFCYTFTPAKDFNGVAVWKFTVCDTGNPSKCTEVTVQINVIPVNDPPIAVDDHITVQSSAENVAFDVLANDIDVDGDDLVLTTTAMAGPYHGTVTLKADGSFVYKSNLGYMGVDSVRYKVCDTGTPSLCDEGVVFIDVGPAPFKIYTGFSPNGDGLNDYWRIDGIEAFPNNRVHVFDRYNNTIFEMSSYNNFENSWKGQANHSMISGNMPEGTYFYTVDLGDGSDLLRGYVVLKKE